MALLAELGWTWLALLGLALVATGVLAGLLAGLLGVGGGIVIVPALYHLFALLDIDPAVRMHMAVGTSLATIIATSLRSARAHQAKGSLDAPLLRSIGSAVLLGAVAGGWLGSAMDGLILSTVFAVVALAVAAQMALGAETAAIRDRLPGRSVRTLLGTLIGALSAVMGIGGGTLGVPALSLCNYPIRQAVGTASALGVLIGVPGTIGFAIAGLGVDGRPPGSLGYVNLVGFALIVPLTVSMAPVGAALTHRMAPALLRRLFSVFLALTALRMLIDLGAG